MFRAEQNRPSLRQRTALIKRHKMDLSQPKKRSEAIGMRPFAGSKICERMVLIKRQKMALSPTLEMHLRFTMKDVLDQLERTEWEPRFPT
jgi:hypothetical protein